MPETIAALVGVIGTIVVSVMAYASAKHFGIGPINDNLIGKLKDVVAAQRIEIDLLRDDNKELKEKVEELSKKVDELAEIIVNQAKQITTLQKRRTRAAV